MTKELFKRLVTLDTVDPQFWTRMSEGLVITCDLGTGRIVSGMFETPAGLIDLDYATVTSVKAPAPKVTPVADTPAASTPVAAVSKRKYGLS